MSFMFIDTDKAPVADSQSENRKNYRLGAIQVFKQSAIQAKIRDFPLDVKNIFNVSYENMTLVHKAFNSTTAKIQVGYKGSEINEFANMMMYKLFNPGDDIKSRSVSTAFIMMIHEFVFEKQFFRGTREGTIATILQGATLGLFAKWLAAVYKSNNKKEILKLLAKNAAGDIIDKIASVKSLSQAIKVVNDLRTTISDSYEKIKQNASSALSEMNICYACYALLLYTGAVHLYFCEQTYPTSKNNQPQLIGLKALLDLYQSLLFDTLFSGKDLREVQLYPNNIIVNSQVNLQSIPNENEMVKLAFATLQYYNNPTDLNQQNMLVCYERFTEGSVSFSNRLSYNDLVPTKAIINSLTQQAGNLYNSRIESFLSDLNTKVSDPESCLKFINEKMSEITEKQESIREMKDPNYVDLVFKAADCFKNGTIDTKNILDQTSDDLINKSKNSIEKKINSVRKEVGSKIQSVTGLNKTVHYVNLEI
ncbi:hypothetical protein [Francisella tularensis]|uniref:hypothetical protein n=1 Tax=Francisella tularensis TaxID=263 RepID=UPI0005019CC6|nr:hypothetical protein [Francisella tularensis]KFJ70839.1 hypothetical protein DR83_1923 [Francisella tularensis subsp. novicida]